MAIYQGVRARPQTLPRRRLTARARAGRSSNRVGLSMAAIITAFLLGLFYLTQTMHVAATSYDVESLLVERERLIQELQTLEGDIARLGAEEAVVRGAQGIGLSRLGGSVRLPAR